VIVPPVPQPQPGNPEAYVEAVHEWSEPVVLYCEGLGAVDVQIDPSAMVARWYDGAEWHDEPLVVE